MAFQRLNLLQLTSTSDLGGAERMALALASNIDPEQFHPSIASMIGGGELIRQADQVGIPAKHLQFKHAADPGGIRRLYQLLRQHKIDVIQTHGLRADSIARWTARMAGVKTVISTLHSVDPWRSKRHTFIDRITSGSVDHWIAVCQAALEAANARGEVRRQNASVVHIGIPYRNNPQTIDKMDARRKLQLPGSASPLIGIVANLRSMKGHFYALDALAKIRDLYPAVHMVFAGRDDLNGAVHARSAQLNLTSHVTFLGFTSDVDTVLGALDIFLLPSDWEGFPVSLLEAMQAGVPVIASRVGGIPEMIRDGVDGLLIEAGDVNQIAASIAYLTDNWALRATMVKSASSRVDTNFSISNMIIKSEAIYLKCFKNT